MPYSDKQQIQISMLKSSKGLEINGQNFWNCKKKHTISVELRKKNLSAEVELPPSVEEATQESRRCLRCDLEFTEPKEAGL